MAWGLVVALAALPLVPPAHVHRAGIESRSASVAHRHMVVGPVVSMPAPHGASLAPSHGSHAAAVFVAAAFDAADVVRVAPEPASSRVPVPPPDHWVERVADPGDADLPHAPPPKSHRLRGPPAGPSHLFI